MTPISILLTVSAIVALSAGGFQMSKLLKKRNSDEFNLGTWIMWAVTQGISTVYAISIGDPLLFCISGAWMSFYFVMSGLIVRYSSSHLTLFKSVPPGNKTEDVPMPIEVIPGNASPLELAPEPSK